MTVEPKRERIPWNTILWSSKGHKLMKDPYSKPFHFRISIMKMLCPENVQGITNNMLLDSVG